MMTGKIIEPINPAEESKNFLLSVIFTKSTSSYYEYAVAIARGAEKYNEIGAGKGVIHTAIFGIDKEQAGRAISLLHYVQNWNGTEVFVNGEHIPPHFSKFDHVIEVIRCFVSAESCDDWRAYCFRTASIDKAQQQRALKMEITVVHVVDQTQKKEPKEPPAPSMFIIPCRRITQLTTLSDVHPSSFRDQFQALAVERHCHWCPHFDADQFRPAEISDWLKHVRWLNSSPG
jgi:hypothetical protein